MCGLSRPVQCGPGEQSSLQPLDSTPKSEPAAVDGKLWESEWWQQFHFNNREPSPSVLSLPGALHQLSRIVFNLVPNSSISGKETVPDNN